MRRFRWLLYVALVIITCGLIWQFTPLRPFVENGFGSIVTEPIPGDERAFDPVADYDKVADFAGDGAELVSIRASLVRSDGTMDFAASYGPTAAYEFLRPVPRPADAPPVGAGGSLEDTWAEAITINLFTPGVWRTRSTSSGGVRVTTSYLHRGMDRDADEPRADHNEQVVEPPRCAFADLWDAALDDGAPDDAVAFITYDASGYTFSILNTSFYYTFSLDCERRE